MLHPLPVKIAAFHTFLGRQTEDLDVGPTRFVTQIGARVMERAAVMNRDASR
jgi:hypothetical protein